ncbi:MAG: tRNA pseudouridine(55) synthase TruB [Oligoflexia bacterium]|nr:tRNA pseudouridine(55) synthase TruB [Oligoflexia bacterium]
MHGLFLIDKAAGYSSAQVVGKLRRGLGLDRVGHAGTLDPFATGLLVALVGRATRLADFVQAGSKVYSGEIILGLSTDSDDCTGAELSSTSNIPELPQLLEVLPSFRGQVVQTPPRISAVKVDGARAYARARDGEEFELQQRTVQVEQFDVWPTNDTARIGFRIRCSKGTYIRSIARDIGVRLGCGACLGALRREQSGQFCVDNAKSVEHISVADILPWTEAIPGTQQIELELGQCRRLWQGDEKILQQAAAKVSAQEGALLIYGYRAQSGSKFSGCGVLKFMGGSWRLLANIEEPG